MYTAEHGPATGTPLTFLHGSMVSGWMWLGQVADLPTYRIFLPDFPGVGQSGSEQWVNMTTTADLVADMIRARCPEGQTHLVGLSLGGIIGLYVAAQHPDVVRSLLVSGVPQGAISAPLRLLSQAMLRIYHRPWGANMIATMFGLPQDESRDAFVQTALQTNPATLRAITAEVNTQPLPPVDLLRQIRAPTLAVVGSKDTAPARRAVPYLADLLPTVRGYVVPEVGHQWNAEQPQLFSEMVREWVEGQRVPNSFVAIA